MIGRFDSLHFQTRRNLRSGEVRLLRKEIILVDMLVASDSSRALFAFNDPFLDIYLYVDKRKVMQHVTFTLVSLGTV